MTRQFLTVILPFLLPFVVYGTYLTLARRKARLSGEGTLPRWQEGPWLWIILCGVVLMVAVLVAVRLSSGVTPGTALEPPRLIDGQVEPSHPVE
jgi:ABC-type Fe3+ transport system permease subunit